MNRERSDGFVPRRRSTLVDEFLSLAERKELEAFAGLSCRRSAGGLNRRSGRTPWQTNNRESPMPPLASDILTA
jgi:hypothetical protein